MFRILIIYFVVCLNSIGILAQSFPSSNLIHENLGTINPSYWGEFKTPVVGLNYQKYWSKVNGSPENLSFLAETSFKSNKFGLGLHVTKNNISFYDRISAGIGYRQTFKLNEKNAFNLGVLLGVERGQIDFDRVHATHPNEVALYSGLVSGTIGKGAFGFQYRYQKLQVGLSAQFFFKRAYTLDNLYSNDLLNFRKVPFYSLSIKYPVKLNEKWHYVPSLIIMSMQGLPFNFDNLHTFNYADKIDFGIGFRQTKNLYAYFGIEIYKQLKISYAYQRNLSSLSSLFSNTHEVGLKIHLSKGKGGEVIKKNVGRDANELREQVDQNEIRLIELKRRIDSLETSLKKQKNEIQTMKSEQLSKAEIEQYRKTKVVQDVVTSSSKPYEIVDESDVIKAIESGNYHIVLGVYRNIEAVKKFNKEIRKELKCETIIQEMDGMYFVLHLPGYTDLKIAKQKLVSFKKDNKSVYISLINGEPWLIKLLK